MIYDIIPFIIIAGSLAGIIIIVVRKLPQAAAVDISAMQKEKDSAAKRQIIQRRLQRLMDEKKTKVGQFLRPFFRKFSDWASQIYSRLKYRLQEVEKTYIEKRQISRKAGAKNENAVLNELKLGWADLEAGQLEQAEQRFVGVLRADAKNLEAYEGLSCVYIQWKDYKKAKETLLYLLKLINVASAVDGEFSVSDSDYAKYHFWLGTVCEEEGEQILALEYLQKAHEYDSNNPKYIDRLISAAIIQKDIALAHKYLQKLKDVNPDNAKIAELKERILSIRKSYE